MAGGHLVKAGRLYFCTVYITAANRSTKRVKT